MTIGGQLSVTIAEQDASGFASSYSGDISAFIDASISGDNSSNQAVEKRLHVVLGSYLAIMGGAIGGPIGASVGMWLGQHAPAAKGSTAFDVQAYHAWWGAVNGLDQANAARWKQLGIFDDMEARAVWAAAANHVIGRVWWAPPWWGTLPADWMWFDPHGTIKHSSAMHVSNDVQDPAGEPKHQLHELITVSKSLATASAAAFAALAKQGVGGAAYNSALLHTNLKQPHPIVAAIKKHPIITTATVGGGIWALIKFGILRV
jgi:hypothetical protein